MRISRCGTASIPPSRTGSLMPVVPVGSQIFDLAFHPTSSVVYTGLLNGKVKAFTYDEQGVHSPAFELRISKRSCRGLALSPDGASLYAVGKNKTMQCVAIPNINRSLRLRKSVSSTQAPGCCQSHAVRYMSESYNTQRLWCVCELPPSAPINRVVHPTPHLLATGDDDGVIKVE